MKDKKQLVVSAINEGTVIDHIPAQDLFRVISILGLDHIKNYITFGTNLDSKKLGKKAIIKISNVFFRNEDINKIALVAPDAKLNVIKDYKVVEKMTVELPDEIIAIARCVNPMCITNKENVPTKFQVVDKKKVSLRCHYCEKITDKANMDIL